MEGKRLLLEKDGKVWLQEKKGWSTVKQSINVPEGKFYDGIVWDDKEVILATNMRKNVEEKTRLAFYSFKDGKMNKIAETIAGHIVKLDNDHLIATYLIDENDGNKKVKFVVINIRNGKVGKENNLFDIRRETEGDFYISPDSKVFVYNYYSGEKLYSSMFGRNGKLQFMGEEDTPAGLHLVSCDLSRDYGCEIGQKIKVDEFGEYVFLRDSIYSWHSETISSFFCGPYDRLIPFALPCSRISKVKENFWKLDGQKEIIHRGLTWKILGMGGGDIMNRRASHGSNYLIEEDGGYGDDTPVSYIFDPNSKGLYKVGKASIAFI